MAKEKISDIDLSPKGQQEAIDELAGTDLLRQQRDALLAALEKYGVHKWSCKPDSADGCTCGYEQAIALAKPKEDGILAVNCLHCNKTTLTEEIKRKKSAYAKKVKE